MIRIPIPPGLPLKEYRPLRSHASWYVRAGEPRVTPDGTAWPVARLPCRRAIALVHIATPVR